MRQTINGADFRRLILSAAASIEIHKQKLSQSNRRANDLAAQVEKMKKQILELWEELPPTFVSSSETGLGRQEILDYIESVLENLKEENK